MKIRHLIGISFAIVLLAGSVAFLFPVCANHARSRVEYLYLKIQGKRTVEDTIEAYGPKVEPKLKSFCSDARVSYPPEKLILLGLKEEQRLELWAPKDNVWVKLHEYPILALGRNRGPKRTEGDSRTPEGFYKVEGLNPNSSYHLSFKINYPNAFDREKGAMETRSSLGDDIFVHGSNASIGCLAMGDEAIEELFILVARTGIDNVEVILSPCDLRVLPPPVLPEPVWLSELYAAIESRMLLLKE